MALSYPVFTDEGKRESVSESGHATKKEAKEARDKVASELSSNKTIPEVVKDNASTKEFYEFWLESNCSSNVKESTKRGYVKKLNIDYQCCLTGKYMPAVVTVIFSWTREE